eukprot:5222309-Prymnesium_polylepis.2
MLKRFLLVGVLVLYQDSMMQLVIGITLAAAFLLVQAPTRTSNIHGHGHGCASNMDAPLTWMRL